MLFELRKAKGMTEEEAERLIKDEMYYGVMMVKMCEADGMVGGAVHSTGDMLRPALQIVKTAPGINTVSGFFIMNHPQKTEKSCFLFADCAVTSRTYVRTACGHCRVQRKIRKSFPCRRA